MIKKIGYKKCSKCGAEKMWMVVDNYDTRYCLDCYNKIVAK